MTVRSAIETGRSAGIDPPDDADPPHIVLTLPASTSARGKAHTLRIVTSAVPAARHEITDAGAQFRVPADRVQDIRRRWTEAGLIDEPHTPVAPMGLTDWAVAIGLAALAFAVRLNALGPSSLWLDDAWVGLSARIPWSALREVGLTAIGFTALVKIVGSVFGPSPLAFQAVPVLFAIATPPLAIVTLRRWVGLWPAALVGLMAALSPIAITFSTRVKQYSFDAFATVGLTALALAVAEKPEDRRRWAAFVAAAVAASVGSSILLVIVAACCITIGLVVLIRRQQAIPEMALWGSLIAAFTLGYWVLVLGQNVNPSVRRYWSARYVSTETGASGFTGDVVEFLGLAFEAAVPLPSPIWAWLLFGAAFATMIVRRWHVALLGVLPLLVTILLSALELAPLGGGRTDTHIMVALFIMTAFAIVEWADMLASRSVPSGLAVGVLSAAIAVPTVLSISQALPYPEQDLRTLVAELEAERSPDDHVLLYYASVWAYGIYTDVDVDLVETDPNLRLSLYDVAFDDDLSILGNRRGEPEQYRDFVATAVEKEQRAWFISSHARVDDLTAVADAFALEGYELERTSTAPGAELSLWVPRIQR